MSRIPGADRPSQARASLVGPRSNSPDGRRRLHLGMSYKLPPLPFAYDALEPHIDAETMELHHDGHHQTYVDGLNKTLAPYPQLADLTVENLLRRLDQVPAEIRSAVQNYGGGHANHQFFWDSLGPNAGGSPKGEIGDSITKDFGSFERFQSLFVDAAMKQFGSGWTVLIVNPSTQRLEILSLRDQDSVLVQGKPGLLCCDVWEHAYYLKHRNRRTDYLHAWWNVIAWDVVDDRLEDVRARNAGR
jgi:Fe-Mn family superoxide dismutase